jgi:hypothetical protein
MPSTILNVNNKVNFIEKNKRNVTSVKLHDKLQTNYDDDDENDDDSNSIVISVKCLNEFAKGDLHPNNQKEQEEQEQKEEEGEDENNKVNNISIISVQSSILTTNETKLEKPILVQGTNNNNKSEQEEREEEEEEEIKVNISNEQVDDHDLTSVSGKAKVRSQFMQR